MNWEQENLGDGYRQREFTLYRGDRPVTGVLWQPSHPRRDAPMVCFGHGASGDRHQRPIPMLASQLVSDFGYFALAIDGPVHGRRKQGDGARGAFWPEWERVGCVEDMLADWSAAIDAVQALQEVGCGPLGYWGLSMGTIFGVPLVAHEPRIQVAVLGLMGISGPVYYRPMIEAAASKITCPLFFIEQREDELFPRSEYSALFDAFASQDKRLHANPGLHPNVPLEELRFSVEFLSKYLNGGTEDRSPAFRISE